MILGISIYWFVCWSKEKTKQLIEAFIRLYIYVLFFVCLCVCVVCQVVFVYIYMYALQTLEEIKNIIIILLLFYHNNVQCIDRD